MVYGMGQIEPMEEMGKLFVPAGAQGGDKTSLVSIPAAMAANIHCFIHSP